MEEFTKESYLLVKSIDDECDKNFSSFEKLCDIIQNQETRIKQLENELKSQEKLNKQVLVENAQYSIELLTTLLNIIWPLTTKDDFQQNIINNNKFIDIIFENIISSVSSDLLFPLIGILANLHSNDAFRSINGSKSVSLILEKDESIFFGTFECQQVFLFLLYNISFDSAITIDILQKYKLLEFIKNNTYRIDKFPELQEILFKFLFQVVNSIVSDAFFEIKEKKNWLIQIQDICKNISLIKHHQSAEIIQIIDRYFNQK